uniref:Uncharacterized protein n=1 Tax=Anguilla anguilla TaxID=7936 RepID=A0A0E9T5V3_ANGAN
MLLFKIYRN